MSKIRLLLLIPHLGGGGAEQVASQLARHLDPERFEVHLGVIASDGPGAISPPDSVTVHRLATRRVRHAPLLLLRLIWAVRPQIVLSGMAHLNQLVLLLRPFLPSRTTVLVRQNTTASLARLSRFDLALFRWLATRADLVICQSDAMSGDLATNFRIPREKLTVLANPIDLARIRRFPQPEPFNWPAGPGPNLLYVGRLASEKGLDLLLQALVSVRAKYPETHLKLLGTGPEGNALRHLAGELGIAPSVTFAGYVPTPAASYAGATLFVLPSRFEGMPNALLEAAAGGLPLVATPSCDGVAQLLRSAAGAWLAREISVEGLTEAILASLKAVYIPLGATVRFEHSFLTPFDTPIAIRAYEELLLSVARERQP